MDNNNIFLTLPYSGVVVELKQRLTFDEMNAVDDIMTAATKVTVENGKPSQSIDGKQYRTYVTKLTEAFVVGAKDKDGADFDINIKLGSMDADDGSVLTTTCVNMYNAIKKKSQEMTGTSTTL